MSKLFPRSSGILLHPTSLPGKFGVGDLGDNAYRFVDWLADHGQSIWQILPLGPTSYGDSPYQTLSAFAGNPNLIALDKFYTDYGWLEETDFDDLPDFPQDKVDYGWIIPYHDEKLTLAYQGFKKKRLKPKEMVLKTLSKIIAIGLMILPCLLHSNAILKAKHGLNGLIKIW